MNTIKGIVKLNLGQSKTAYIIVGICFLAGIVTSIVSMAIPDTEGNTTLAIGNYLYLLPMLMAIFIPTQNFTKLMNLGGKRKDFFIGSIITYLSIITACTVIGLVLLFTIDQWFSTRIDWVINLYDVFGFIQNGPVVAFLQMTVLSLMLCCVLHTLTMIQGRWYGWITDALIVAIISVFTPIAPLRAILVEFFNIVIFHDIAFVQILACLVLSAVVYCLSLIPINTKQI